MIARGTEIEIGGIKCLVVSASIFGTIICPLGSGKTFKINTFMCGYVKVLERTKNAVPA